MYDNIGNKIKTLAKWMFIVEAIGAIITGISLIATDDDLILLGLLIILCGPIVAWVSSWFVYGYGQLIQNSDIIADEYKRKNISNQQIVNKTDVRQREQLRKEVNTIITNSNVADDEFVDLICPHCGAELSYTKEQIQNSDVLPCPMCDSPISL